MQYTFLPLTLSTTPSDCSMPSYLCPLLNVIVPMFAHRPGLPFWMERSNGSRMSAASAVPATSMPAARVAAAATPAASVRAQCLSL